MLRSTIILGASLLSAAARADTTPPGEKVGDAYLITREARTSTQTGGQSTGTTFDRDTISERVVAVRADGLELQYDLPGVATPEQRTDNWQFPARIFRAASGSAQLINRAELEARVDRWLRVAKIARAACGHWVFTWNAFKIECDPQSVLNVVAAFDLRPADLRDGAPYRDPDARDAAPLKQTTSSDGRATYTATLIPDGDKLRRDRAQSDVVIAEISGKPVTLDAAMRAHAGEAVSGSITISFDTDSTGAVRQRTKVVKLQIKTSAGAIETRTATETLRRDRQPSQRPAADGNTI